MANVGRAGAVVQPARRVHGSRYFRTVVAQEVFFFLSAVTGSAVSAEKPPSSCEELADWAGQRLRTGIQDRFSGKD